MTSLPFSYYMAAALFVVLLLYGTLRLRAPWAFPFNAVLCTVAAWYLIEPIYFPEQFAYFDPRHVQTAFDGVVIFFATFALLTPFIVRQLQPRRSGKALSQSYIPAERILILITGLWLVLLAFGVYRMQGDLLGALFPLGGRSGARMWGRAAGAGAGSGGFIVSTASYLYVLCLASFGVMLFFLRNPRYRAFAITLILISWPYAFLQGARNVTLAVIVPAALCYLLFSRQSWLTKAMILGVALLAVEFAMRVIIHYRNEGFQSIDLSDVEGTTHLGLNMASELVYAVMFIDRGLLEPSLGLRYLAELANVIPRALWPDKPLVGVEFAILRGFGDPGTDIGVFATISSGVIGQGVQNFGTILGPVAAALLMSMWVGVLARFRVQETPLRQALFLIGLGLTFNLGRDITLLVLWPMVFAYLGVRAFEFYQQRQARRREAARRRLATRLAMNPIRDPRPARSSFTPSSQ